MMANIDLQILLDKLVEENSENGGPIPIQPDEFCDLLTNGDCIQIYDVALNRKVILNDKSVKYSYPGYTHLLKYEGKEFSCSTSIEIIKMDYLWCD